MKKRIYLAGGWFNPEQKRILDFLESNLLKRRNLKVFSPRLHTKIKPGTIHLKETREKVFEQNIENIHEADYVIASTAGKDMGCLFECGVSFILGKPIIYFYIDKNKLGFNLMLAESASAVITNRKDFLKFLDKFSSKKFKFSDLKKWEYQGKIE